MFCCLEPVSCRLAVATNCRLELQPVVTNIPKCGYDSVLGDPWFPVGRQFRHVELELILNTVENGTPEMESESFTGDTSKDNIHQDLIREASPCPSKI